MKRSSRSPQHPSNPNGRDDAHPIDRFAGFDDAVDDPAETEATPDRPSKTRRKKAMHDLQDLGEDLLAMPAGRRKAIELPERLQDAIDELERVRSHEGRRRQLQYIGKLMREVDPEPIREAVAAWKLPSARETLALHQAEHWRDRLVDSDQALTLWMDQHPDSDAQALRTLIRNARREKAAAEAAEAQQGTAARKGKAWRELFQVVKDGLCAAAHSDPPAHDIDENAHDD